MPQIGILKKVMRLSKHFKFSNKHSRIIKHASTIEDLDNIPYTKMRKIDLENFTCYYDKFNYKNKYFLIEIEKIWLKNYIWDTTTLNQNLWLGILNQIYALIMGRYFDINRYQNWTEKKRRTRKIIKERIKFKDILINLQFLLT